MMTPETFWSEVKKRSNPVVEAASKLLHQASARRLVVKNAHGRICVDVPLTIGVIGAAVLPLWMEVALLAIVSQGISFEITHEEPVPGATATVMPPAPPAPDARARA